MRASDPPKQRPVSGARLFLIATEGGNGIPQLRRTLQIASGECHGESEFELLKLVIPLAGTGGRAPGGVR